METIQGSNIFQEWAKRFAPGLYRVEGPTKFNVDPSLSMPASPTPTLESPVADPAAAPMEVAPPAEPGASLTDRFNAGLSRVGEGLKDPAKMGLLTAGLSMIATPPRAVKYSPGEIIGNAGLAGVKMFETALEAKRRQQALDVTTEEHRLAREDMSLYRKGQLEVSRQNAASSELLKTAASHDREAAAEAKKALQKPISKTLAEYYKLPPETTVEDFNKMQQGIVQTQKPKATAWKEVNFNGKNQWVDLNSPEAADLAKQGAFGVKDKPGFAYFVGDDGRVTEVQKGAPAGTPTKVVAPPGTGKKTKPGGAGGPKQFEYQDAQAKASLVQKGIAEPTIEQIAAERQKLFPKGVTKPARNPRAAMTGSTRRVKMPDGSIQEFDAAGNRVK